MTRSIRGMMAVVGLAVLAGCSEPLAPEGIAGVYGWSGVLVLAMPNDQYVAVVADTMILRPDRTGVHRNYSRWGADDAELQMQETEFGYVVEGRAIGIMYGCSSEICAADARRYWFDLWGSSLFPREEPGMEHAFVGNLPDR